MCHQQNHWVPLEEELHCFFHSLHLITFQPFFGADAPAERSPVVIETFSARKTFWFREINKSTSLNQPPKNKYSRFLSGAHTGRMSEVFQPRISDGTADKHTMNRNWKTRLNTAAEIFWRLFSLGRTKLNWQHSGGNPQLFSQSFGSNPPSACPANHFSEEDVDEFL